MSAPNFHPNQKVIVKKPFNHILADDTVYTIGGLDRISGRIIAVLLKDGKCIGSCPESCLEASK